MKDILLPVAHVFALVMMVFAVTMLAPLVMAVWGLDPALWSFVISALATFVLGALLWLATRRFKRELKTRDGLMLVALTWVALPAVAGFPLWHFLPINFTDAYFEAASGLTTTGGTVLSGLEFLPRSINLWRHLAELAGRHGHHRAGRGHPAHARRRRHADLSRGNAGADEGQQAHAAHRTDRQAAVGGVCRTDGGLHRVPEASRA